MEERGLVVSLVLGGGLQHAGRTGSSMFRGSESHMLCASCTRVKRMLGWAGISKEVSKVSKLIPMESMFAGFQLLCSSGWLCGFGMSDVMDFQMLSS